MSKKLVKNISFNLIYNFLKLVFPLITFPYASRILGAEGIGQINFSVSFVSYFALIASLGIPTYAVREGVKYRDNKEKINDFCSQIFSISIISTIIALILLIICAASFDEIKPYFLLIIIYGSSILLTTIGVDWICSIYEDFVYIAIRNIIFQLISLISLFLFVRSSNDGIAYIIIYTISGYGSAAINFFYVKRYVKLRFTFRLNLSEHIKPIMILFGGSIATSVYMNVDTIMLGLIKGDMSVGLYSAAVKVTRIILSLVGAINLVLLPRLSRILYESKKGTTKINLLEYDLMIVIPMGIGLFLLSEPIIVILCGYEYITASIAMKVLSISFIFSAINNCIATQYIIPRGDDKFNMLTTVAGAAFNAFANVFFIINYDYLGAAWTTLFSEVIVFIFFAIYLKNRDLLPGFDCIFHYIIASIIFLGIGHGILNHVNNNISKVFLCFPACVVIYLVILILIKDRNFNNIFSYLKNKLKNEPVR